MRDFLTTYGLWAVFFLAVVENDVAFIGIGVAWKLGSDDVATPDINMWAAFPVVILGALLHDTFWFVIGHVKSAAIKASRVYRRVGPTVERLADRLGPRELLVARFFYGTRTASSVFWGIQKLPYTQFAGLELLALTVWGSLLVALGFHATSLALKIIGHVDQSNYARLLMGAIVVAFIGVAVVRFFNRRGIGRIQKKVEARKLAADEGEVG
jgi:membrane protein DedA with SNARE-associated domain